MCERASTILAARRTVIVDGHPGETLGGEPAFVRTIESLDRAITEADRIMAGLPSSTLPVVAREVRKAIEIADEPIRDFRLAVRAHYADLNDLVSERQTLYLTLITALILVGGLCLVFFWGIYSRQHGRLRHSEETFRNTFDRAGVGIGHLSPDGRFLRVNATLCGLLGHDAAALCERDFRVLLPEMADFRAFIEPIASGKSAVINLEHAYRGQQGVTALAVLTLSLVRKRSGEIDYVILIMEDVTERRLTEAQLQQAQKMEAVGQLTGGVAHDFNNLLGVIVGNLDMLDTMIERKDEAHLHLQRALTAAERGASLTGRLLAFSRRQTLLPRPTDVNRLITDIGVLLRPVLGDRVELKLDLAAGLRPALIDASQLESAIVNLAINARDAMEAGGTLSIGTHAHDHGGAPGSRDLPDGEYVTVTVADSGAGMPPEILDRVFEPFFMTKDVGKGSGLGLSMVYGFAKQSGGHVQIESMPGQGTTVTLYLPVAVATRAEVA